VNILCDRIANPENVIDENQAFSIENGKIRMCSGDPGTIYLPNTTAIPGLINIHDHLKYSWHKRIGKKDAVMPGLKHYQNVYCWLKDLYKVMDGITGKDEQIPGILCQLGLYKQIFSGVTTVVNHSRLSKNEIFGGGDTCINVFDNFTRELVIQPELLKLETAHPVSFKDGVKAAYMKAAVGNPKIPFMIHAAEGRKGIDEITGKEIRLLKEWGILTPETILVHCINTDSSDMEAIARGGSSVVWCPYSSDFVIGGHADIPAMVSYGINICIGTDSSCSGSTNLIAEMRYAQKVFGNEFNSHLSSAELFNQVTVNPARALLIDRFTGRIADGYNADIVIIDKQNDNPYDDVLACGPENIAALLCNGIFVYGDKKYSGLWPLHRGIEYTSFWAGNREKYAAGIPGDIIESLYEKLNIKERFYFSFIPDGLQHGA
jgi:cytosine/adenosine deaminase-related metal-dependent hydrolase